MVPAQALAGVSTRQPGALFLPVSGLPSQQARFQGLAAPRVFPGRSKFGRRKFTRHADGRIVCSAANSETTPSSSERRESIFGSEQDLPAYQKVFKGWSAPARYALSTVIVAGALAGGYAAGRTVKPNFPAASLGGAAAAGAVGGLAAFAINSAAPTVAAVQLHNALVNYSDPKSITSEEVDSLIKK
jgi:hypothetical protein